MVFRAIYQAGSTLKPSKIRRLCLMEVSWSRKNALYCVLLSDKRKLL